MSVGANMIFNFAAKSGTRFIQNVSIRNSS
jgi:hypothetical protein